MARADQLKKDEPERVTGAMEPHDEAQRFTALYRKHYPHICTFARRRVGTDLAQEIVAETFLVAWRRIDDIPSAALPWLYRVALYEIANLRRRQEKAIRVQHALLQSRPGASLGDPTHLSDLTHAVAKAFEALSPLDQEILRLAAWEHLSTREGAAVLQCSVAAYRMRLHRARIRLADVSGARAETGSPQPFTRKASDVLPRVLALGHQPLPGAELAL